MCDSSSEGGPRGPMISDTVPYTDQDLHDLLELVDSLRVLVANPGKFLCDTALAALAPRVDRLTGLPGRLSRARRARGVLEEAARSLVACAGNAAHWMTEERKALELLRRALGIEPPELPAPPEKVREPYRTVDWPELEGHRPRLQVVHRTNGQTWYSWECSCGAVGGMWRNEERARDDFTEHLEGRLSSATPGAATLSASGVATAPHDDAAAELASSRNAPYRSGEPDALADEDGPQAGDLWETVRVLHDRLAQVEAATAAGVHDDTPPPAANAAGDEVHNDAGSRGFPGHVTVAVFQVTGVERLLTVWARNDELRGVLELPGAHRAEVARRLEDVLRVLGVEAPGGDS